MNPTDAGPLIILFCLAMLSSPCALATPQQAIAKERNDVRAENARAENKSAEKDRAENESAESKIAAGDRARLAGNYPLAQQQIMLGLKQIESSKSPSLEQLAAAYNYLALLNNNMGQYSHSENNARKALAFATKAGLSENILSRHRVVLANALRQQGKYPEALSNLEQVTATLKNSTKDKVLFATATNNLGALYFWMGNYQKAQTILERGLALRLALSDGNKQNLDIANSYLDLGCCEFKLGQTAKAREHLSLTLSIRKNKLGNEHPETLNAMANLAALLDASASKADRERALELLQQAVNGGTKKLDGHHPELIRYQQEYAEALTNKGNILSKTGQEQEALRAFEQAIRLHQASSKASGQKEISYAITLANAAEILKRLHRLEEGQSTLNKANAVIDELPLALQNSPEAKAIRQSGQLSKSSQKRH